MKDIFKHVVSEEKLSLTFRMLENHLPLSPAKNIIEAIAGEMNDNDGNFIQQFQTTGFNARIWEMFLFKFVQENGFKIIEKHNRPDFNIEKDGSELFIEASLSAETGKDKFTREYIREALKTRDLAVQQEIIDHYVIRMGSVLYSKLQKKYWELEWVKDKPLVLAVAPSHHYLANFLPDAKIMEYLYGFSYEKESTENGFVIKKVEKTDSHTYEAKEIPPYFFSQENTENISAVLFTNNCDLHKFNRMGYQSGMSDDLIIMERAGFAFDKNSELYGKEFSQSIIPGDIKENWSESVSIFHNPNAKIPLDRKLFKNIRQVWINEDGEIDGTMPEFFAFHSKTLPVAIK